MVYETAQFIRGVAIERGITVDNPFEIKNPVGSKTSSTSFGVHFYACATDDHRRDALNWAVQSSTLLEGLDPYIISFGLSRDLFSILKGRLFSQVFNRNKNAYEWVRVSNFDRFGCEVQLNGRGMPKSDIERLGVILERVEI